MELLVPLLPDFPLPLPPDLPDFPDPDPPLFPDLPLLEEEEDDSSSGAGAGGAAHPSEAHPSRSRPLFVCFDERERLMRWGERSVQEWNYKYNVESGI